MPGGTRVPAQLADAARRRTSRWAERSARSRGCARAPRGRARRRARAGRGRARHGGRPRRAAQGRRFSELELELKYGDQRALRTLAKRIARRAGPHRDEARPRPRRRRLPTTESASPSSSTRRSRAPRARPRRPARRDPEDVHQLRVALRRSSPACAAGAVDRPDWAEASGPEVALAPHGLGPARDADVFHLWLRDQAEALGTDGRALARLDGASRACAPTGTQSAPAALDDARTAHLLFLLAPPRSPRRSRASASPAPKSETARLRKLARKAGSQPDDELLHRLRLRGKRTRYALELAQPELGSAARTRSRRATAPGRARRAPGRRRRRSVRLRDLARFDPRGHRSCARSPRRAAERASPRSRTRASRARWSRFDDAAARI